MSLRDLCDVAYVLLLNAGPEDEAREEFDTALTAEPVARKQSPRAQAIMRLIDGG